MSAPKSMRLGALGARCSGGVPANALSPKPSCNIKASQHMPEKIASPCDCTRQALQPPLAGSRATETAVRVARQQRSGADECVAGYEVPQAEAKRPSAAVERGRPPAEKAQWTGAAPCQRLQRPQWGASPPPPLHTPHCTAAQKHGLSLY